MDQNGAKHCFPLGTEVLFHIFHMDFCCCSYNGLYTINTLNILSYALEHTKV